MSDLPPDAERVLAVIYMLAGGRAGVTVTREDLECELRESGILDWPEEKFQAWKRELVKAPPKEKVG